MLERLRIADWALVEHAEVVFGPGLNAVTGETGAGKSLLVQAVGLLVGGRAEADQVRAGARAAVAEAEFRPGGKAAPRVAALLADWGLEAGETLIVRREVQAGGRTRATVDQSPVTLASLQRLGALLVDLHGQHEHQSLLAPGAGVETLDRLAGHGELRAAYDRARAAGRAAAGELERLEARLAGLADRRAWMEEAARELDEARLEAGEEDALRGEAARLAHADRLRALAAAAVDRLAEGEGAALDRLAEAAHALEQAAALDPDLEATRPALEEARIAAAEAARALAAYGARLESDPEALERVEARRETLARLTRKYRRDVAALIDWRDELARELALGEDAGTALARARADASAAAAAARAAGEALSAARRAAAAGWSSRLSRELAPLGMPRGRLDFVVEPDPEADAWPETGLDRVEMRFAPNPGEPPRPLRRIASGGELSRVMLALKAALETQDPVDLLIFDEVDSGIGGAIGRAVGERLRALARHRQIVCVTHLPTIAAQATHHLRVTKHASGGRTRVRIEPLEDEARVEELARMLAGDLASGTTRRQARELLDAGAAAR